MLTLTNNSAVNVFLDFADTSDTTFPFCLPQEKPCETSSKKVYYFIGQKNRYFIQAITGPDVMLFYSDWNTNSQSRVDASKLGCASVLAQEKNDVLRPVRFASREFSPAESRWVTFTLATLSCIMGTRTASLLYY